MPEFPRAPITDASAAAWATSGSGASGRSRCSASAMDFIVRVKLVPVSPSGTGNTLMRFSSSRPAPTHSAAASSDRRRRGPSTYPIEMPKDHSLTTQTRTSGLTS